MEPSLQIEATIDLSSVLRFFRSHPGRTGLLIIFIALLFAPPNWSVAVGLLHAVIAALVVLYGMKEWMERHAEDDARVARLAEHQRGNVPNAPIHTLNKPIE